MPQNKPPTGMPIKRRSSPVKVSGSPRCDNWAIHAGDNPFSAGTTRKNPGFTATAACEPQSQLGVLGDCIILTFSDEIWKKKPVLSGFFFMLQITES
ncbi:MAG TPA: hypothetical protein VF600_16560 [Abditibacteriaceae bacterium]